MVGLLLAMTETQQKQEEGEEEGKGGGEGESREERERHRHTHATADLKTDLTTLLEYLTNFTTGLTRCVDGHHLVLYYSQDYCVSPTGAVWILYVSWWMSVGGRATLMLKKNRRNYGDWERRLGSGPDWLDFCYRS